MFADAKNEESILLEGFADRWPNAGGDSLFIHLDLAINNNIL